MANEKKDNTWRPRGVARFIPERFRRRVSEALTGPALGTSMDEDVGWRRITQSADTRDLDPLSHEQMLRVCRYLYESNGLAGFLVDVPLELAIGCDELGYDVTLDAKLLGIEDPDKVRDLTERIRAYLDPFWEHPFHSFRRRTLEYMTSLLVDGNLTLEITGHNETTGVPRLDFIDSAQLKAIKKGPLAMVPGTAMVALPNSSEEKALAIAQPNPATLRYDEDAQAFYWRFSRIPNSLMGRSILLRIADDIDALNQYLWTAQDRGRLVNSLVWDVKLEGATATQCRQRLEEIMKTPPTNPGTVMVHNEKEDWSAKTAQLNQYEAVAFARFARNHILGSRGIPESWYSDGSETNRATAGEQSDVARRTLESLQSLTKSVCGVPLAYAYDRAAEHQEDIPKRVDDLGRIVVSLEPTLPPVSEKDLSKLGPALVAIEQAVSAAVEDEMLSEKTSRRIVISVVNKLSGVEIEPDEEVQEIEAEEESRQKKAAEKQAEFAAQAFGRALPPQPGQPPRPGQPPPQPAQNADGETEAADGEE